MAESTKDTIYIDIDDEITSIVEKVRGSKHKILALVLPKRATTLQSIVNMKLLKHTAEEAKKSIVLITSEASLLPLAGAVGLHVAKTLQSKPAIPPPPDMPKGADPVIEEVEEPEEPDIDESAPVGDLAGLPPEEPPVESKEPKAPAEETIDIDNSTKDDDKSAGKKKGKGKDKGKSKIKIPNFDSFRKRLILAVAVLVLLIVGWIFAFNVLPKATITIKTNNVSVNDSPTITLSTSAKTLDLASKTVPATIKDTKITSTQKATATGTKNVGNKAAGSVSLYYCPGNDETEIVISAGTGIVSNGLVFTTTSNAVVPASNYTGGGNCKKDLSEQVNVTAAAGGTQYNLNSAGFAVSNNGQVTGSGSTSGGTDQNVTVVSQGDIDGAKQKIVSNNDQGIIDLSKAFKKDNLLPIQATLVIDEPAVTATAKAGDQVSDVTVTVVTTYHMLGVKQDDLQKLIGNDVKDQIDTSKQQISDYGLDKASYTLTSKKSNTEQTLTVQTTVTAGAQIDTASLKKQIAGKKKGDAEQTIKTLPSVESVSTKFSPFWVNKVPSKASRVTIIIDKPQAKTNAPKTP